MAEEAKKESEEKGEEKSEESQGRYNAVQVPTATELYIQDSKSEDVMDQQTVNALILNKLDKIEKSLG